MDSGRYSFLSKKDIKIDRYTYLLAIVSISFPPHFFGLVPLLNRDVEMGVCLTDRGFKKNLTELTGKFE